MTGHRPGRSGPSPLDVSAPAPTLRTVPSLPTAPTAAPARRIAAAAATALRPVFGLGALARVLYALLALPLGLLLLALVPVGLLLGVLLSWTAPGLWLLALTVRGALAAGALNRALTRWLLDETIEPPPHPAGPRAGARRRALLRSRAGWRAVGWCLSGWALALPPLVAVVAGYVYGLLLLAHPVLRHWNVRTVREPDGTVRHVALEIADISFDPWPRFLVPMAAGALLLAAAPLLLRWAFRPYRWAARAWLGPSAADLRIRALEESRALAVTDSAATLRRLERDLHDGTQARLVGLGMHLTLLRELLDSGAGPERLGTVLDTARENAHSAVVELRDLVKGIHPPVLDQGLDAALSTLLASAPLPAELTCALPRRPGRPVEAIAYFCAAELVANAVKHSGAQKLAVDVRLDAEQLVLTVRDDGRGGAVVGAGSGLSGLRARAGTVDGTLECASPPGGPTVVTVRLPASGLRK
ncbi:hypothetical protein SCA03_03430 [Streptomyces cacaoi]|uniref:histidine kinase n=1 Tax=Streptomyces cacaoi TaxID=1898 RepID=A0A4Y3QRH3_STRCI|nr:hypothetical protein SCA03_03430 [Streptomyces cacaoi]